MKSLCLYRLTGEANEISTQQSGGYRDCGSCGDLGLGWLFSKDVTHSCLNGKKEMKEKRGKYENLVSFISFFPYFRKWRPN